MCSMMFHLVLVTFDGVQLFLSHKNPLHTLLTGNERVFLHDLLWLCFAIPVTKNALTHRLTEGTLLMLSCCHMNNWYPHVKIGYLSFNTDIKYFAVRDFYILQSPNLSSYFYIGAKWTARRKQNLGLFRLYFVYSVCAIQIVDFGGSFMCVGSFCILIRRSEWIDRFDFNVFRWLIYLWPVLPWYYLALVGFSESSCSCLLHVECWCLFCIIYEFMNVHFTCNSK